MTPSEASAAELKQEIISGRELAILDVREEGTYFERHLLWASNAPLSRIELLINDLVPRRSAPIVVYDSGKFGATTPARRAKKRLTDLGFSDVRVLSEGIAAWQAQGFELFSGLNVPSKAFGEFLLQNASPPEIKAPALQERIERNDQLAVFDSRPLDEFQNMSIPTAVDVPGAELVHRVFELAPDPNTDIVVNCAGRTRSIVGAQSLINAGVPHRVMLLKDGTMGWHLAGLQLDHGNTSVGRMPSAENHAKSLVAVLNVADRFQVSFIDRNTLHAWQIDPQRTLYLIDVRTEEEFLAGHLPHSRHVPGGQLVQTTDEHIAVRNARIVLVDEMKTRAILTASWLMQMGHKDVHVLDDNFADVELESGTSTSQILGYKETPTIEPGELHAVLQSGESAMVIDLSSSRRYMSWHIPKAAWCVRQRLAAMLAIQPPVGLLTLTSQDGVLAHLAAADLSTSNPRQLVRVLSGGNEAWRHAGFAVDTGMELPLCEIDDVWDKPYDRERDQEKRMQEYLEWEVQLMDQVDRDGTAEFYC